MPELTGKAATQTDTPLETIPTPAPVLARFNLSARTTTGYSIETFPAAFINFDEQLVQPPDSSAGIKAFVTAINREEQPVAGFVVAASNKQIALMRSLHRQTASVLENQTDNRNAVQAIGPLVEGFCRENRLTLESKSW